MTEDHVIAFLTRVAVDDELLAKCYGSFPPEQIVALAARHGFEFTTDEMARWVATLSDAEWNAAALRFDQGDKPDSYFLFIEELPMSKEAIAAFFKKVAEDTSLQKKLVEFAAQNGFEFSSDELNDVDLDSIAGGVKLTMHPGVKTDKGI